MSKKISWADCDHCGGDDIEVFNNEENDLVYDGDTARCLECGATGNCSVCDDHEDDVAAYIDWQTKGESDD